MIYPLIQNTSQIVFDRILSKCQFQKFHDFIICDFLRMDEKAFQHTGTGAQPVNPFTFQLIFLSGLQLFLLLLQPFDFFLTFSNFFREVSRCFLMAHSYPFFCQGVMLSVMFVRHHE